MRNTVLYAYHGQAYEGEAISSIKALRNFNLNIDVNIVAPSPPSMDEIKYIPAPISSASSGFAYKVNAITKFEQARFLFLDTDTNIVSDISELFLANQLSGISGVIDPLLNTFLHIPKLKCPINWNSHHGIIPELNSGVLAFNLDKLPSNFMETWCMRHSELCQINSHLQIDQIPDQPSLRQAMIECNVVPHFLGVEFNYRPCYPQTLYRAARIIHIHKYANTSHYDGAGINGDVTTTFPWGLAIRRTSYLNRIFFCLRRLLFGKLGE